jgi:hypothetical protein
MFTMMIENMISHAILLSINGPLIRSGLGFSYRHIKVIYINSLSIFIQAFLYLTYHLTKSPNLKFFYHFLIDFY